MFSRDGVSLKILGEGNPLKIHSLSMMSNIKKNPCGGPELPTGSAMVPPPGPVVTGATSGTGVSKTPTHPRITLPQFSVSETCQSPRTYVGPRTRQQTANRRTNIIPSFRSFSNSLPSSPNPPSINANKVKCPNCKKFYKGRRGLNIHFGRSATCKQAVRHSRNDRDTETSIPQEVKDSINCPSTCVEDLDKKCGDGLNSKIKHHNSKHGCNMCHILSTADHFVSTSTHRIYKAEIPSSVDKVDCNSCNLIYLITCRRCALQYVGETCQKLRVRFNFHKAGISHPEKDNNCRILSEHFSKGPCQGASYTVKIVEKLYGDGRDSNGEVDPSITVIRRKKETEWMLRLRTVFPYGLNDRIGNEYMTDRGDPLICKQFPPLKRNQNHFRVRTKTKVSDNLILSHFPYIVMESIRTNRRNTMNLIRVLLSSLNKPSYKKLGDIINDFLLDKHDNFPFSQFFCAALDIISSHVWKPIPTTTKRTISSKLRLNVQFCNKGIDFINLPQIMNHPDVVKLLPSSLKDQPPMVVFDLVKSIRSKVFNYKQTVQELDVDAFLANPAILPCSCTDSSFKDAHHGHIISGDLRIVQNKKLQKLLIKGPKYGESEGICWNKARDSITIGINDFIKKNSNSERLHTSVFTEWKCKVLELLDDKINALKANVRPRSLNKILNDDAVKKHLEELQEKYVIVPIDKADSNVAFVCKRYYIEIIAKELGLLTSPSNTYECIQDTSPNEIVENQQSKLKEELM